MCINRPVEALEKSPCEARFHLVRSDISDRPSQAVGSKRSVAVANHEMRRFRSRQPEQRMQLAAQASHLDRLVDKRIANTRCRGPQREALVDTTGFNPGRAVVRFADEDSDSRSRSQIHGIGLHLHLRSEYKPQQEPGEPGRQLRVPADSAGEPVS